MSDLQSEWYPIIMAGEGNHRPRRRYVEEEYMFANCMGFRFALSKTSGNTLSLLYTRAYKYCWSMLQKLWFQHVWPCLQQEMRTQEVLASVLQPIIYLIQECTLEEYEIIILPPFRYGNSSP